MGRSILRQVAIATLVAVCVCVVLAWPAYAWSGGPGLAALGLAGAVCVLGALVGRTVAAALGRMDTGPDAGARAHQAGIVARLLATLALTLPAIVARPVPMAPFAAWLAVHYLAQLVLEVFVSLEELGQNHAPTATGGATGEDPEGARGDSTSGERASGTARR